MKEEINLLPASAQQIRFVRLYLGRLGHLFRLVSALLFVLILIIGAAGIVMRLQISMWQKILAENEPNTVVVREKVVDTNTRLKQLEPAISYEGWSKLIPEVLQTLPSGMQLTELSVGEKGTVLTIRGTFTDREMVVLYQRSLERLAWVKKLEAPLSNFATGSESQFMFNLTRK